MPTCFAALMCHAPVVQPEVAGARAPLVAVTTRAMREVAARAVASRPDRLVVISPHSPRHRAGFAAWRGPRHTGDLGAFRNPQLAVDLPDAPEVGDTLKLPRLAPKPMDHGAVVPLTFLAQAGWTGPTAVLALPLVEGTEADFGRALADLPGRTAVIASGDMSHRLTPGAPSGFHPKARDFDAGFVAALAAHDWDSAANPALREEAAEDVVRSTRVAFAAAGAPCNAEVLAYEGPFGVGYAEAVFYDSEPPLYAVARISVVWRLQRLRPPIPAGGPGPAGVFVTIHKHGALRGCIGHIVPHHPRLHHEVWDVAWKSAAEDHRFTPITVDELPDLSWEVSVLEPPERISGPSGLDPRVFGVIVANGRRRGVLLPDLPTVSTVERQLAIARQKAGIAADEPVELSRFRVRKVRGPDA